MEVLELYKLENILFLKESEKDELSYKELSLFKINHVKSENEIPSDYIYKYVIGKDIDLF